MVTSEEATFTRAAKAVVDSILACEVSDHRQSILSSAFKSILSFRLCLSSLPGSDVLLSTNLLLGGEVMFAPIEAEKSCAKGVASQCRPAFISGDNVYLSSDLSVITRQETTKAFFCVPLPTNYRPIADNQPSSSTGATESPCLGAIIIGFHSENEVAEQDLRSALLTARHIAVNHHTNLEALIAGIAPVLSTENDPNNHPGWGNAGGLLQSLTGRRRPLREDMPNGGGGGGGSSRRARFTRSSRGNASNHNASGSSLIEDSLQRTNGSARGNNGDDDHCDEESSDSDSDELSLSHTPSGSIILNPIQHALLQSTHRLTLAFPHASLERQYQAWRGTQMARLDSAALTALLAYHIARAATTSRNTSTSSIVGAGVLGDSGAGTTFLSWIVPYFSAISRWEYLPCTVLVVPFLLAALPLTHKWYSQKRELFVAFLYIVLAWHHIMAGAAATASGGGGGGAGTSPFSFWNTCTKDSSAASIPATGASAREQQQKHGCLSTETLLSGTAGLIGLMASMDSIWISVLSVILHVRYPWQTIMLIIAATVSSLVASPTCPGGGEVAAAACWAVVAARLVIAQMLIPGIAMYWLEYNARKAFCATPAASYFAWRLEGERSTSRRRRD